MNSVFLSRFTPSLLAPEALEAIFVQRESLASSLVERIRTSALTANKHYSLVIGPRGIGKTHLVSLVYHRVKSDSQLSSRLICAWLREEEWGITSFLDLLVSVLRTIRQELSFTHEEETAYQSLFEFGPEQIEQAEVVAEQVLLDIVGDRALLVIVENLDDVFEGMGKHGQQKLRAHIQNHPKWTMLASSQSLFAGVSLQDSPFYGFFDVSHLRKFSFENAMELLIKVAQFQGDRDLSRDLLTTTGRSRIRAVHHLAAGNPRVYIILSQFLTSLSLDQIVGPLMRTLDDLTPYYQARMSYLSPQQRKLVEYLCERRGAVAVKDIAKHNFLTHSTVSSQLKKLRELGYVRPARVGRESFFELREPLMRLSLEVKKQRGKPIRLLVKFLRLWFSRDELRKRLEDLDEEAQIDRRYLVRAMESFDEEKGDPRIEACLSDYKRFLDEEDYDKATQVAEELVEIRGFTSDLMRRSKCLRLIGRDEEAKSWKEDALSLKVDGIEAQQDRMQILSSLGLFDELLDFTNEVLYGVPSHFWAWWYRGVALDCLGNHDEALEAMDKAIQLDPEKEGAWNGRGVILEHLNRHEEARGSYHRSLEIVESWWLPVKNLVRVLIRLGQREEVRIEAYRLQENVELHYDTPTGWCYVASALDWLGDHEEALKAVERASKLDAENARIWELLGICRYRCGRLEQSLDALNRALALEPEDPSVSSNRAVALSSLGCHDESLEAFGRAIELADGSESFHIESNRAVILMLLGRFEDGQVALERALARFSEAEVQEDSGEVAIVRNMLIRTQHVDTWRRHIKIWIDLFKRHDRLTLLGQGLLRTIRTLSIPWITTDIAQAWNSVWQELGTGEEDLEISLRLFDAAVQYLRDEDVRVLLSLPAEERALLEPLLESFHPESERKLTT